MTPIVVAFTGLLSTAAVGLLTGSGWPGYLVGAVLAVALWVILRLASGEVAPTAYAVASVLAVALGGAYAAITGGESGAWWAPAFVLAGVICSAGTRRTGEGAGW